MSRHFLKERSWTRLSLICREQIKPASPMPDRFEYQITISSPQRTHTVTVSESLVTDTLRPLVDHLTELARTGKYR